MTDDSDYRKFHMSETERDRIKKMIREGLPNPVIKIRTGRSKTIIRKIRNELELTANHAVTGE